MGKISSSSAALARAKFVEETGESLQVVGKIMNYQNDEGIHPDGGAPLPRRLEVELADLLASIEYMIETHGLDTVVIKQRIQYKVKRFREWGEEEES